ncbi:DUF2164 domain-containing protein [Paenibacillus sp. NPDC056579]|uniref:DUF2164 domain-containing protein n=1 Tax=unclassified Paenibacillus TaxID=185978 RepID=UPI001EF8182E|nr:DUF2164 domain-containing protein [Paenibacillus sp. H1-7]ULL17393.1 DUF2164 domain-containing protein [Paenibacillus sp. H1-7]
MMNIRLPKEHKEQLIERVQQYFYEERSEELGRLAAEQMLDFFISQAGPFIYNQAVADSRQLVTERFAAMEDDLYTLEKPIR